MNEMNTTIDKTSFIAEFGEFPVLSVRQPWAWAIFHGKDIENREWKTHYRGRLYIHAAKTFDDAGYLWLFNRMHLLNAPLPPEDAFLLGGIIGQVLIDAVHPARRLDSPWAEVGMCHWQLSDVQELPFLPLRGLPGIFKL